MTCLYLVVLQNTRCSVSDTGSEHHGGHKFCTKHSPTQALALTAPLADLLRVDVLLSKTLQVEALAEVERAFVHVDYIRREELEHKVKGLCVNVVLDCFTCLHLL